ncbi:MAG: hypothetical protein ACKVS5_06690 [Parvularculaceae bacterium]
MGEALKTVFVSTPWAPLAIAFLVGLACGWLVWGLKSVSEPTEKADETTASGGRDDPKEIIVIRAELEAARSLLDDGDERHADIEQQLGAIDETIKRANGRLKILLRAIKTAANGRH